MLSFWEKQFYTQADIIVIGTGLVGLQCATQLKVKYGKRKEIWAIDRGAISFGASTRNAGFACFGSMGEIWDDVERVGENAAFSLYENRYKGLKLLLQDLGQTRIGYEQTGGFEIFLEKDKSQFFRLEDKLTYTNHQLKSITGSDAFQKKNTSNLQMNIFENAFFTPLEGALQTHLLYNSVVERATEVGVKIFGGIIVKSIEQNNAHSWNIFAENEIKLQCKQLILCTNGFTQHFIPELDVVPARGQVLVTSPIAGLPWRGLMHADKGYIYFRTLGSRILIGGARNSDFQTEATSEMDLNESIQNKLVQFLKDYVVLNESFQVEHKWSGIMGMAQDRTPIVRQINTNLYACVRMGGMGVALSSLVSRQLAQIVDA